MKDNTKRINELAVKLKRGDKKAFEELYKLHYDAWYKDYKAHGFEVIMHRYAGAIERLKYTAEVIRRYLAGELECIEELEPETLHGEPTKWHSAKEFMYVSGH